MSNFRRAMGNLRTRMGRDQTAAIKGLRADVYGAQPDLGVIQIAEAIGMTESLLYACLEGKRKFPMEKVGALCEVVGTRHLIEALCSCWGGSFLEDKHGHAGAPLQVLKETIAANATFQENVLTALADGRVTPDELREAVEGFEAQRQRDADMMATLEEAARKEGRAEGKM